MATIAPSAEAEVFYVESLEFLKRTDIPFLVGGTFAVRAYTGITRRTKDLDIFCKAGDYPRIIQAFADHGYEIRMEDERWIAKVFRGESFFDLIYSSANAVTPVTDEWFQHGQKKEMFGMPVMVLGPTELIWSKVFVQDRTKYDGSDVVHLFQREHTGIDWKRLMSYAEQYWEVLLIQILNFRFVYPSERELIPRWVLDELLNRLHTQINLPTSRMRMCRGRLYSREDYAIDVFEWGFADIVGGPNESRPKR